MILQFLATFLVVTFLVILTVTVIFSMAVLVKARFSPLKRELPGKDLWNPFLGNVWEEQYIPMFDRWRGLMENYGLIYRFYTFLGTEWVHVLDPVAVRQIMLTDSSNYYRGPMIGTGAFEEVVGSTSLLLTKGDLHRKHRALVSPAFRLSNIRKLLPFMTSSSHVLIGHWKDLMRESAAGQIELDMRQQMSRITLTVIGLTSFGFDFNCIDKESPLATALEDIIGIGTEAKPWHFIPYAYYLPVPRIRKLWAGLRMVQTVFDSMLLKKSEKTESKGMESLLDMIVAANADSNAKTQHHFSRRELRDELMTFILAGHETSSLALTWSLYFLSKHPEIQDRVREEVWALIGQPGSKKELTWDGLESLALTKAVIYESLRLRPPIPFFTRTNRDETTLGGFRIPAGTAHLIHVGQMHRLPQYWKDPGTFNPDRFLADDAPWEAWMPFGEGTHKCVGYKFALAEMTAVLALLVQNFRFHPPSNPRKIRLHVIITLQPVGPVPLLVESL